jgi:hypothetical protein
LVDVYEFMIQNNENEISRWSYYDEYLRSNKIRRAREKHPELDTLVVKKVRTEEIKRAVDLRDELPIICSSPKSLAKFVTGAHDFSAAYDSAIAQGGDSSHLKTTKRFREWITRNEVEAHLLEYDGKVRSSLTFELQKIESRVRHLLKRIQAQK